jgi:hypothetical protein
MSLFTKTSFMEELKRRTGIESKHFPDIAQKFIKTITFFGCALVPFSIIMYYALTDPAKLNARAYIPSLAFLLPLGLIFYYFNKNELSLIPQKQFITLIILLILISLFLYYASNISAGTMYYITKISYTLFIFILIIGLAIIYLVLFDFLKKQTGILGLISNFIFFIPCLIIDAFEYMKKELQTTPSTLFVLFILEIVLILIYFYYEKWLNKLMSLDENYLQETPLPLNKQTIIAKNNTFTYNVINTDEPSYKNNNYAISFWVYVNTNNSANEYNILSYGSGKPQIVYKPDTNDLIVYFSDAYMDNSRNLYKINLAHTMKFTPQKWVHIVINYFNNRADLFINGIFEYSFIFDEKKFPLAGTPMDTIYVGESGLNGAISRISYYQYILPELKINRMYNMYKNKIPP